MSWELVKSDDRFVRDDRPFISISAHRIAFSAAFVRVAELGGNYRVSIYADEAALRIGFEFHLEKRPFSLALVPERKTKSKKQSGLFCSSHGLLNEHAWAKGVARLPSRDRRFYPKRESNMWVIDLCPAFEIRNARESLNIPTSAAGIYRYLRENGEIVYIGRGNILKRLASPEREDWVFDVVEYSVIPDPDQQVRWESFWIDKFRSTNGRLPFYNKVGGGEKTESVVPMPPDR